MDDNLDHLQNYRRSEVGYGKIASYIKCSKPTVAYWIQQYRQDKDLTDKQRLGRLRTTTKAQDNQIVKMAKKKHDITSTEIQQKLKKKDVTVSSRTIRRRLVESGGKFVKEISKPLLFEQHRIKRLKWAKKHKNFDWNKVIFTDESTFQLFQSNRKVHVWGCFSVQGFGKLICFERNLDALFMCSIYERGLIPSACELFGIDSIDWILQEYNDPKHRSKICKKWKEENEATVLPWPSMSPNQNPIENVWQLLKIKISKKKINTTRILKAQLAREWNQLSEYLAKNLVNSMERRVTALIEVGGDFTMY
ncbi:IS630 family transposase [Rhizophagus clarus]|uniref:IS630 family transposase n=1 Tax=Rhizophagus clarus TaxID=94130 RepID=A0A8H3MH40_9GLOM|nr:IS630 family transposase [Rhizophagus clarus]